MNDRRLDWACMGVIAGFLLLLLPALSSLCTYHGDERFYTDAALEMESCGDYMTPKYSDGSARFNKPILTYWLVVVSHRVLGVSAFSSRLPFLLSACGTLWVTYRIGILLFRRRDVGLVAMCLLAGNSSFVALATRSTPDSLLILAISLGAWGFLRIIFFEPDEIRTGHWAAYVGAGLAIACKGGLGILLVGFAVGFTLLWYRGQGLRRLVYWPALAAGASIGLFWFAALYGTHGTNGLSAFAADQVSSHAPPGAYAGLIARLAFYAAAILKHFLPWLLILIPVLTLERVRLASFGRDRKGPLIFTLAWLAVMLVVFSAGHALRGRYMTPVYPLLAVWLAGLMLLVGEQGRASRWVHSGLLALLFLVGPVGGVLLALFATRLGPSLGACACILAALGFLLWHQGRSGIAWAAAGLGLVVLLLMGLTESVIKPALINIPAPALATALQSQHADRKTVYAVDLDPNTSGQIRLLTGGAVRPVDLPLGIPGSCIEEADILLLSSAAADRLELRDFVVEPCGYLYHDWSVRDLLDSLQGNADLVRSRLRNDTYLAVRRREGS